MDGAVFDLIRRARNGGAAVLCAFDLIELDGEDLRGAPAPVCRGIGGLLCCA